MTDFWTVGLFSLAVLLVALGLIWWHVSAWQAWQRLAVAPRERDYRRRQFRRRMQTSTMLGILAVGIFLGRWLLEFSIPPLWQGIYWSGLVFLLLWMGLLAGVDAIATRLHFGRMRQDCLLEQTRLQAELRRLQEHGGDQQDGKHRAAAASPPD